MSLPIKTDELHVVSGGASNPRVVAGTVNPTSGVPAPEGSVYLRYVAASGQVFVKSGTGDTDWTDLVSVGGTSLDGAYDFGGSGAGRTIVVDSGAVQLDSFTANTQAALQINRQPSSSAASVGIDLVLNANVNTSGAGIQISDPGAGNSIRVTKSNAGSAFSADLTNASAQAINITVTGAPTSVSPIALVANTTGTTAALVSISKIPGATTAGNGISVSMGANTTGVGIISTNAGPGAAVSAINSSSVSGAMSIQNSNVAGPVDFYALDNGGTSRMSWGYGNASYSDTARASRAYVWRNTGVDFVFARTSQVDAILTSTGTMAIGSGLVVPRAQLHVQSPNTPVLLGERTTAVTAGIATASSSLHTSSGDMTDGFGPVHTFQIRDNAGVDNIIAYVGAVRAGGDTTGDLVFTTYAAAVAAEKARITSTGRLGIGTTTPFNSLDVSNTGASQIHISNGSVDSGGYLTSTVASQLYLSGGLGFDGTNLRAKATTAAVVELNGGNISFQGSSGLTIGAITAMTERMLIHVGGGVEIFNSDAATVSNASRGKIRYTTSGQKFQVSSNAGSYFDVATYATTPLVAGAVMFANGSNQLAQNNPRFTWNNTNESLGVASTHATDGPFFVQSLVTTGPSGMGTLNSASAFKSYWGFFNSAYAFTYMQNKSGVLSFGGENIIFGNATIATHEFGMTSNSLFFEMFNGGSAAVSSANAGRLRYNTTGQKFQVSMNGAAYVDLATGSGSAPTVERLSVDGAADPTIDTTFVSGTGTDLTLANGSTDGFIKNFVVTGGSGTITPTNLADGNVLTWTTTPANVSLIWDATGTTWHVYGNPYNMVTT